MSAGVFAPAVGWRMTHGPWFHNGIATISLDGRDARLSFHQTLARSDLYDPGLETVCVAELTASQHGADG